MLVITAVYQRCPAVTLLMSATQATVTGRQVAVRYQWYVGSLSIDMSTDTWPIYRSRYVGRGVHKLHMIRQLEHHLTTAYKLQIPNCGEIRTESRLFRVPSHFHLGLPSCS